MSALLAALQRLEGRAPAAPLPSFVAPPAVAATFTPHPISSPLVEPLRSAGWDEVTLPVDVIEAAPPAVEQVAKQIAEPTVEQVAKQAVEQAVETSGEADDGTAAFIRILPAPALAAVVAVDAMSDFPRLLRGFGEALSARTLTDVVLLGPGTLDDAAALTAQWEALRPHVGYGLVHATADRALLQSDALQQTAGVIAVVELGRTSFEAVKTLCARLAERGVPLLGTLAIRDE